MATSMTLSNSLLVQIFINCSIFSLQMRAVQTIVTLILANLLFGVKGRNCPTECSCPLDIRGRWQVLCTEGGLQDPLPVLKMRKDAEVLIVTAPEHKPNTLTLGPIFRRLPSLEEIVVVNSKIPAIGEHSFWGLRKLISLNVSHNAIHHLLSTNFKGPDSLKSLDLSHNLIESVPSAVFRNLKLLQILDLSYNRIPELASRVFLGLSVLDVLDLSYNPLGELHHNRFSDLPSLTVFKCNGCGLLTVSESLMKELRNLQTLELSNNRLISIPPLTMAHKLSSLKLNGNLVPKIQAKDLQYPPLQAFSISHNRISVVEDRSFENKSIMSLDLSYNRLASLEPKILFPIITSMKDINFSGNSLHIDQLIEILPKARQLRQLGLGDLGLTRIPSDLLRRSRHLRTLNISSNYLSKFPHELLYSTPHLQSLDLSANSFRGLNQHVIAAFNAMSSLSSVRLERNPWQCQKCHITHLLHWLQTSPKQPHAISSCRNSHSSLLCLKCIGPEQLAGEVMVLLKVETLNECTAAAHTFWPEWNDREREIIMGDDPRSSINKRNGVENSQSFKIVANFFKDHLALLVGIVCGLVLAIMLVVITAVVCSRRQSAYYYTCEDDMEKSEKLVGRNNNDSPVSSPVDPQGKQDPFEPMAILKVHHQSPIKPGSKVPRRPVTACLSSKVRPPISIATIEEMNSLDPCLETNCD